MCVYDLNVSQVTVVWNLFGGKPHFIILERKQISKHYAKFHINGLVTLTFELDKIMHGPNVNNHNHIGERYTFLHVS